jgi:uncharacterized membrane protein
MPLVSRYDWLLFLHLVAAFALMGAVVVSVGVLGSTWRTRSARDAIPLLRLGKLGDQLGRIGGVGTIVFGVWLAVDVEGYALTDGWIIASLALWLVGAGTSAMTARSYHDALAGGAGVTLGQTVRSARALTLHVAQAAATVGVLALMIWKPGA